VGGLIIRRLLGIVPLLVVVSLLTFLLLRAAPGSPFDADRNFPEEIRKNVERKFKLDQPWYAQYGSYMGGLVAGDLPSLKRPGFTIWELIAESFPHSLLLGALALGFAVLFGVTLGVVSGVRQNTTVDHASMSFALLGISVPNFVLGPLLILTFSLYLGWFPPARWEGIGTMVLPAITLGMVYAAYIARLGRAGMLDVIRQDFVRTARAKGLSEDVVVRRHALRGGILPVVTFLGPAAARILTGTLVVERIFQVPGMGYYFVQSALDRDHTMVLGAIVFYATFLMVLNLAVDVAYGFLDPRVKYA
jgi:oligopeptide transport system permease protein